MAKSVKVIPVVHGRSIPAGVPLMLQLTAADRVLLGELLAVAQTHILEVAAMAEARAVVNPKLLPRLRAFAQSAAGFIARLEVGA